MKKMIKPVNGHLLIEPVKHETFIAMQKETYEEIGIVIAVDDSISSVQKGDRVYFDAWLAAKYPKNDTEFYWMVKWEDIRAIERDE